MAECTKLPARVLLQVREGKLNRLSEFELEVASTVEREDGTLEHSIAVDGVIGGLGTALRDQIKTLLQGVEDQAAWRGWLLEMRDWMFEEVER